MRFIVAVSLLGVYCLSGNDAAQVKVGIGIHIHPWIAYYK